MIKLFETGAVPKLLAKNIALQLIDVMHKVNIGGYIVSEKDLTGAVYEDQDGNKHYILLKYNANIEDVSSTLYTMYNSIYNTGTECHDKSVLLNKISLELSTDIKVDSITIMSILLVLNPFTKDLKIMSEFWYVIMKLSMPEIFNK